MARELRGNAQSVAARGAAEFTVVRDAGLVGRRQRDMIKAQMSSPSAVDQSVGQAEPGQHGPSLERGRQTPNSVSARLRAGAVRECMAVFNHNNTVSM